MICTKDHFKIPFLDFFLLSTGLSRLCFESLVLIILFNLYLIYFQVIFFFFIIFFISFPFSSLKCFYFLDELESLPPPPPVFQTYGTNRGKSIHLFFRQLFLHTVRFIKLWNSPVLMLNSPTNLSTKLWSVYRQVSFN